MYVDETLAVPLKKWIIKKLEDISDADSDVLADYVLALIRSEDPDEVVRANAEENLKDFLRDGSHKFVDEVFAAIGSKAFLPSDTIASDTLPDAPFNPPNGPSFNPPTGPSFNPPTGPSAKAHPRQFPDTSQPNASPQTLQPIRNRKRAYNDRETEDYSAQPRNSATFAEPASKFMRRGNQRLAAPSRANAQHQPYAPISAAAPYAPMNGSEIAQQLQGADLSSAIPAMMAQIQAMGAILSSMTGVMPDGGMQNGRSRGRCFDYDTKGFCARGSTCPYEHGANAMNAPPNGQGSRNYRGFNPGHGDSTFANPNPINSAPNGNRFRGGRGGRGTRAPFSSVGRNLDRSITTIVIENIPEDYFSKDQVREYFSQFGAVAEVAMQPYKRLAMVKYEEYSSALKAYESPKTIFDNRFVKVFWYKPANQNGSSAASENQPSSVRRSSSAQSEDAQLAQDFGKMVEEAQRKHEEKVKSAEEAKSKKAELDEKIKQHAEETKRLRRAIATREKNGTAEDCEAPGDAKESQDNEELKAQIARLEAEALGLGLDPDNPYATAGGPPPYHSRGRGGGYRGRAWHPRARGRGRGFAYGGRGAAAVGVMRLDNRPKKVSVNIAAGSPQDEALRSYLFNKYEVDGIEPHPSRGDAQVVSFKQRYMAESFIGEAQAALGRLELAWFAEAPPPAPSSGGAATDDAAEQKVGVGAQQSSPPLVPSSDLPMPDVPAGGPQQQSAAAPGYGREAEQGDLDVADDDQDEDRWMK